MPSFHHIKHTVKNAALLIAVILFASKAAFAQNVPTLFPMNEIVGNPSFPVKALWDYSDAMAGLVPKLAKVNAGGAIIDGYPNLLHVHILPDRIEPSRNPDSGLYEFEYFVTYDNFGYLKSLTLDIGFDLPGVFVPLPMLAMR